MSFVINYLLALRGSTFSCRATQSLSPGDQHGLLSALFSKTETTMSFVINYLLALRGSTFSCRATQSLSPGDEHGLLSALFSRIETTMSFVINYLLALPGPAFLGAVVACGPSGVLSRVATESGPGRKPGRKAVRIAFLLSFFLLPPEKGVHRARSLIRRGPSTAGSRGEAA